MLTLQYLPYNELNNLASDSKIKKILNLVRENKILLMEGRLNSAEEARLIEKTMEEVSRNFKGIEICSVSGVNNKKNKEFSSVVKDIFAKLLLGNRHGLTIIGPASIVKEIRKDPNKIELLTEEIRKKRRRRR